MMLQEALVIREPIAQVTEATKCHSNLAAKLDKMTQWDKGAPL